MNPYIDIRYNIFTDEVIQTLIQGFDKNIKDISKHRDTLVFNLATEDEDFIYKKFKPFIHDHVIDWAQIVKWPTGSSQILHTDGASDKTTLSSITYLNDNFNGGETFFEDGTMVKALKNKTIFFTGKLLKHGVKTITQGERYTIATFYKKQI
tara:strand:- start:110 stop:565 length:456 start_codon:yes stop_codon:yes gene_type:complete